MKAPPFDYHRPASLRDALLLLKQPDARILAGGQSLVPMLNFRLLAPQHLVDLSQIDELRTCVITSEKIRIGAMVSQRELERSADLSRVAPIFPEAIRQIGHRQTRNRGTIGGSLCHLDPSAELPTLALLHDAIFAIASPEGVRHARAQDFIQGAMNPALEEGEILTHVEMPVWRAGHGFAFLEHARRAGDFALASAGILVAAGDDGRIARLAICIGGLGDRPMRLAAAERELIGAMPGKDMFHRAAAHIAALPAEGSIHASAPFKRRIAETLLKRALEMACARAALPVSHA